MDNTETVIERKEKPSPKSSARTSKKPKPRPKPKQKQKPKPKQKPKQKQKPKPKQKPSPKPKARRSNTKKRLHPRRSKKGKPVQNSALVAEAYAGAPDGIYESTANWLASVYDEERYRQYYREYFTEDVSVLADSRGVDDQVHPHFRGGIVRGHPAFTAVVENARVWEKNGAVITPDNKLLADVSWDYHGGMVHGPEHNVFRQWHAPPLQHIKETSGLLTFIWSGNYYHWLFDVLPRVELLRLSGMPIEKYIVPRDNQTLQDETLNLVGIPRESRIEVDHDFHAKVDVLVVPSFVRREKEHPSEYPKWAAEFLRNEFLFKRHVPRSNEYERIFISRAKAWQRRLLNEDEVRRLMQDYGFRVVVLEELPFMEQVGIFASASVVVAPHGAGLSNLVFCNPGTIVIEMLSPNYVSNYFWHLSNQIGLIHYYMIGERYMKPNVEWWEGSADFDVDVHKLNRLLHMALNGSGKFGR